MTLDRRQHERLARLIGLVDREDRHLLAVRQRLLGEDCAVDSQRLRQLLDDDIGIDRLESFGAKFSRMQDTIVDKLVPAFLLAAGEQAFAAIDNLGKIERLGLIVNADDWLEMRALRNRLIHEYIDRPQDLAPALEPACRFTGSMHADYRALRRYPVTHLGIDRDALPHEPTS